MWNNFLMKIKDLISPMLYETWFSETKLIKLEKNTAKVLVPMHVHKKHLKENYMNIIQDTFTEVSGTNFKFEFLIEDELENNVEIENLGVPEFNFESNIKPQYTFENFIVGESNKFAKATALAVAEKPGTMYNPLFIYGNSGLGKTHLMHAIGNYIINNSKKRVLYVTSEQFVNDFIDLYRKNKENDNINDVQNFKRKYRDIDVLMIDDIQYLQIANSAQQEFFNTFNELYGNNKQIIISSDRSPDDLTKLENRLQTRFNWGITIDILPPNLELRIDIINKKLESYPINDDFPIEVKEYIASCCTSDIRKLEGAITRIMAYATIMNGSKITLNLAEEALKDYFAKSVISKNNVDKVQMLVADHFGITVEDMKSKKRLAKIAFPRQIAMYICRVHLEESLPKIGVEFGGKDHTTVMHSVDKIKKEITRDKALETEISKIVNQIKVDK